MTSRPQPAFPPPRGGTAEWVVTAPPQPPRPAVAPSHLGSREGQGRWQPPRAGAGQAFLPCHTQHGRQARAALPHPSRPRARPAPPPSSPNALQRPSARRPPLPPSQGAPRAAPLLFPEQQDGGHNEEEPPLRGLSGPSRAGGRRPPRPAAPPRPLPIPAAPRGPARLFPPPPGAPPGSPQRRRRRRPRRGPARRWDEADGQRAAELPRGQGLPRELGQDQLLRLQPQRRDRHLQQRRRLHRSLRLPGGQVSGGDPARPAPPPRRDRGVPAFGGAGGVSGAEWRCEGRRFGRCPLRRWGRSCARLRTGATALRSWQVWLVSFSFSFVIF